MIDGTLIVESLRTGTNLENLKLTVRKISRLQPQGTTPGQPGTWTTQMNAADDPRAARQWYGWSIVEADRGLEGSVHGALRVLERHGLIWDRGDQLVPPPHGMQHEYEISPYGDYLIDRLAALD